MPALSKLQTKLVVNANCTACGACVSTCHNHAIVRNAFRPSIISNRCDSCYECVEICPRDAIHEERYDSSH